MKNFFSIALLVHIALCAYTQGIEPCTQPPSGYVRTPKCSLVPTLPTGGPYSQQQQNAIAAAIQNQFPLATILGPADPQYNCHGYAWHMTGTDNNTTALQPPVWIDFPNNFLYLDAPPTNFPALQADGSYVQVPCEALAQKVLYTQFDHSAITTDVLGKFRSKWDSDPLMYHTYNYLKYAPLNDPAINYTNGSMKFFRGFQKAYENFLPVPSNSPIICQSTKVLNTSHPTPGATISWTVSPAYAVTQSTGTGNNFTLTLDDEFLSGTLTVTTTATACGVQLTSRVTTIPVYNTTPPAPPYIQIFNPHGFNLCPNRDYTIFLQEAAAYDNSYGVTDYQWQVTGGTIVSGQYTTQIIARFPDSPGNVYIKLRAKNCKGWGAWKTITATVYASTNTTYCSGSFLQADISPNPASGYVDVALTDSGKQTIVYQVTIADRNGVVVKSRQATQQQLRVATADLPEGTYYLYINYGEAVLQRRLIIKR